MKKNTAHTLEFFKAMFYSLFPESKLEILELRKSGKVLVKDCYGTCLTHRKLLILGMNPTVVTAVDKSAYFKNQLTELYEKTKYPYDISLIEYKNATTPVKVICKLHGEFKMNPTRLISGSECHSCARISSANAIRLTTSDFIKRAKLLHKCLYNYSKTVYKKIHEKVIIICSEHGEFLQTAANHLSGRGCKRCAAIETNKLFKSNYNLRSYSGWKKMGEKSKNFDSFKVYVLKCWNENEIFYKIGKTFIKIEKRFKNCIPYQYEILEKIEGNADYISNLEKELHLKNKEYSYSPLLKFNGDKECFSQLK